MREREKEDFVCHNASKDTCQGISISGTELEVSVLFMVL